MKTVSTVAELHQFLHNHKSLQSIGFVPTMGNLHTGHISLVEQAKKWHDVVIVSIFVNRKQFNQALDYSNYPKTFEQDCEKLASAGAELLFCPEETDMYPEGMAQSTIVVENTLTHVLCGATRPGHFEGVTTVVAKLLNIIQPDSVYLGEKDYQQCLVIKKMINDLFIPCQLEIVPTFREDDGLAMSSRNNLLTSEQRQKAPLLRRPLAILKDQLLDNSENIDAQLDQVKTEITKSGFKIDYLECRSNKDLSEYESEKDIRQYRIFVAAFLGDVRLIDNIRVV
jgi:pantoate--beta-alanine ligase